MISVTATDLKNKLGKYLDMVLVEGEIYITRNSRRIAKIVPVKNEDNEIEKEDTEKVKI